MTRAILTGALSAAVLVLTTGCGPAKPPELDKLPEGREAVLFNGEDLTGWEVIVDDIFYDRTGKVEVVDGSVVLGAGQELTAVRWAGKVLRDNFRITFQARRIEGEDFFCGLTFPVRKGHVTLILGGWAGTAVGLSNIDDMSAIENETTQMITFKLGKWYDVEVEVHAGRIVISLDNETIIDQEIGDHKFNVWPQMEPPRPLGIATYCTKGAFRNVVVRRLPAG